MKNLMSQVGIGLLAAVLTVAVGYGFGYGVIKGFKSGGPLSINQTHTVSVKE